VLCRRFCFEEKFVSHQNTTLGKTFWDTDYYFFSCMAEVSISKNISAINKLVVIKKSVIVFLIAW